MRELSTRVGDMVKFSAVLLTLVLSNGCLFILLPGHLGHIYYCRDLLADVCRARPAEP